MCHSYTRADTGEQRGQTCEWGARTPVTSPALSFFFLFSSFPQHTLSLSHPSLMPSLSSLPLSLYAQIGPAVHQPSRSSPSCLPSPNEKPYNNTGHRSRERTGCVYNGPVAPSKTIIPFFSSTIFPLLPGLEKTNLWRESWRGGSPLWTTASEAPSLFYNCLKDHSDKHTWTHQHLLSPLPLYTLPPLSLSISRAIMLFNIIIKVKIDFFPVI